MLGALRPKIQATISSKRPVLDPEHPHIMEEARWWVNVKQTRTRKMSDRLRVKMDTKVQTTGDVISALTSGLATPSSAPVGSINLQNLQQQVQQTANGFSFLLILLFLVLGKHYIVSFELGHPRF